MGMWEDLTGGTDNFDFGAGTIYDYLRGDLTLAAFG
jgi:hypothetical protein